MHRALMLSCVALLLIVPTIRGQESDDSTAKEKLQALAPLIGSFKVVMTNQEGEQTAGTLEAKLVQDGAAIQFFVDLADLTNNSVIGWDPKREAINCVGFLSGTKIDQVWDVFNDSVVVMDDNKVAFMFRIHKDGKITGKDRFGNDFTFEKQ